jgi:hypothetical protein
MLGIRSTVLDSTKTARPSRVGPPLGIPTTESLTRFSAETVIDNAREAERTQKGRQVAIALDTKGPEIRTGNTKDDVDLPISAGAILNITTDEQYATASDTQNM